MAGASFRYTDILSKFTGGKEMCLLLRRFRLITTSALQSAAIGCYRERKKIQLETGKCFGTWIQIRVKGTKGQTRKRHFPGKGRSVNIAEPIELGSFAIESNSTRCQNSSPLRLIKLPTKYKNVSFRGRKLKYPVPVSVLFCLLPRRTGGKIKGLICG